MDGQLTGNHSRTRTLDMPFNTTDLFDRVRGSLALFQASPLSLRLEYAYENPHNEQVPLLQNGLLYVLPVVTKRRQLDGFVRLQRNTDSYLDMEAHLGDDQNSIVTGAGSVSVPDDVRLGNDRSVSASGNTRILGWTLNSRLSVSRGVDLTPRVKQDTLRYRERAIVLSRSMETTLNRNLTAKLSARLIGSVSLDSYDYDVTRTAVEATPSRDSPRQSWRGEGTYVASENFRNTVTLEVSRWQDLNLSGRNSASNNETRSYRAEWSWTGRLLKGLTVNQRNSVSAGYSRQLFNPGQNRLSLDYTTVTTLNAAVTPRLAVDLTHNAGYQPAGSYKLNREGIEAFSPSSEGRTYLLNASARYTASQALTLSLNPSYYYRSNGGRLRGVTTLQRADRTLSLQASANVNAPVGRKGRLTGTISRAVNDQGTTEYTSGRPGNTRGSETDFWQGTLQFSWKL
jgi:hypothetical protein